MTTQPKADRPTGGPPDRLTVRRPTGGPLNALLLAFALLTPALLQAQRARYADTAMAGISNQGKNPTDPYVAAGDRAYLIGTQDGNFPDLGGHVPGEMGGLWVHPIKLI